jgi:lipid-A-disaccharide synthase-like uncharacterized protein
MNEILFLLPLGFTTLKVTGWKLIGWTGGAGFLLRWVVQAVYRKRTGTAEIPTAFWIISLVSAAFLLSYFIFGKNDSVGIMSNLFPMFIASYNLHLDLAQRRQKTQEKPVDGPNSGDQPKH